MDVKTPLNKSIEHIGLPERMKRLPVDERGYPVPWFVAMVDGKYDFRVIHPGRIAQAYNKRLCWLCGEKLGQYYAFVIGPMCSVNRVSSEPPSHLECAQYAVKACPFLTQPRMRRNEKDMPEDRFVAGKSIPHNPGATLIWVTKYFKPFAVGQGTLFEVGEPTNTFWYAEGQPATREQILAAFEKGLPHLRAEADRDGKLARAQMEAMLDRAMKLVPKE